MDRQPPLPIEQAETSREAYAEAVRGCKLPGSAVAVALWILEHGVKDRLGCDQVVRATLPAQRELARRLGKGRSSICRALLELEREGLLIRPAGRAVLNLSRVCELADARATAPEPLGMGFAPGWQAGQLADRGPPGEGVPACPSVSQRVPACPTAPRSENERSISPEFNRTDTDTDCARALHEAGRDTAGQDGAPRDTAEHDGADGAPRGNGRIRHAMTALNRSRAWQALQARDFADAEGRRCEPPIAKLRAAFYAAADAGLVDAGRKLDWLATVHDCAHNARSPAGALAWRTAAGKLYWAGEASRDWARQILYGRAPDDPIVVAMAAAFKVPDQ